MNTLVYYLCLYALIIIGVLVGAYLKVVPDYIVVAGFSLVFGHGSGLFTPAPEVGNNATKAS